MVKAIRIGQLNQYMKDRNLRPFINQLFAKKEKKFLEEMYYDTISDHTLLTEKKFIANTIKLSKLYG